MLDLAKDITSLSHFKRNTAEVLEQLKATARPVVLTINGKAEAVVQDAAAYQKLLDLVEKADMLDVLSRSHADIDAGRTSPARKAIAALGTGKKKR